MSMVRPKLVVVSPEQPDQSRTSRDGKKYRIELSRKRMIFYLSCFAVALCWMFILGVLAGRGLALISSEDISVRAEIMRFLGLGRQTGQPAAKAAESWEEPKEILNSLNYYQDLTRKETAAAPAPSHQPLEKAPAAESGKTDRTDSTPEPEKPARPAPSQSVAPGEHFTLLVSSLQDPSNAQRLIEQLKAKGYSARLETLDLNGRWNRVLVGSFQSRDEALKFAAEFNKSEKMEGLVIRESN